MKSDFRSDCRFLKLNDQTKSTLPQNFKSMRILRASRLELVKNHEFVLGSKLEAGGKPSTWFPPGGLVEQIAPGNIKSHYNTLPVNIGKYKDNENIWCLAYPACKYRGI